MAQKNLIPFVIIIALILGAVGAGKAYFLYQMIDRSLMASGHQLAPEYPNAPPQIPTGKWEID